MTNNNILQWNCRGLTANFPELDLLLQTYSPAAICLQETFQNDTKPFNLRKYSHFYKNHLKNDGRPGGGVSIFIKRTIPHSQIQLNTPLQATAVRVSLHRPITVCSIYLPPSTNIDNADLDAIVSQLPPPVMLLGDFNAHSPLWGCSALDNRGKYVKISLIPTTSAPSIRKPQHIIILPQDLEQPLTSASVITHWCLICRGLFMMISVAAITFQ